MESEIDNFVIVGKENLFSSVQEALLYAQVDADFANLLVNDGGVSYQPLGALSLLQTAEAGPPTLAYSFDT